MKNVKWMKKLVATCMVALSMMAQAESAKSAGAEDFSLEMKVDLDGLNGVERLYDGGSFFVQARLAGKDKDLYVFDRWHENYMNFSLADGTCPVIEAIIPDAPRAIVLSYPEGLPPGRRVGIPMGALKKPSGIHDIRVTLYRTSLRIEADGQEEDLEFLVAPMAAVSGAKVVSPRVKSAEMVKAVPPNEPDAKPIEGSIQYWTAGGYNTWVGDVTVYTWKGRLHLFFLKDRRHHRSKGASGGHFFAHISSDDLVHWQEHPVVTPIDEYWFTCGTGTPFEYDGKLCLTYGVHSTRYVPREKTTEPKMLAELKANGGVMPSYRFAGTDLIPLGATWASSADGIHFQRSGIVYHTTQNPAIENLPDGTMRLTTGFSGDTGVGGVWKSKTMDGWVHTDEKQVLGGDCPCPFEWNGWRYLLQGFLYYAIGAPGKELKPVNGDDIYDGLSVPMVASWAGNRRIMAGWVAFPYERGWGGWLIFRELVQRADGTLGTKFVNEIVPPSPIRVAKGKAGEKLTIRFAPQSSYHKPVEFGVDPKTARAYATDVQPDGSLGELIVHDSAHSIGVANIRDLDRDYEVRYVMHYDRKADATIFDFEIAGNRTLIVRRNGRFADLRR